MSTRAHTSSRSSGRPISASARRTVYVEIPPSSYRSDATPQSSSRHSSDPHVQPHDKRKETAPLRAHNEDTMPSANAPAKAKVKRKRSQRDVGHENMAGVNGNVKKQKVPEDDTDIVVSEKLPNANEEFPNGFFYCHQCAKKRDATDGLHCTFKTGEAHLSRCKQKYCKQCLKNRYGEDVDAIKERGVNSKSKDAANHVKGLYLFKCKGDCNCRACRKAQGLEPTGNLTIAAKRAGGVSVASMLAEDKKMTGILPGKGKQVEKQPKKPRAPKAPKTKAPAALPSAAQKAGEPSKFAAVEPLEKPKRVYVRKPKPFPRPVWTRLPVPQEFTLEHALSRIAVREFIVRFASSLDISRTAADELEDIGGSPARAGYDEDEDDDIGVVLGWVSEQSIKGVVVGLLNILADSTHVGPEGRKIVKAAVRDIRSAGANLNRIWGGLASIRASLATSRDKGADLTFPDPLSPLASATVHTTRSGQLHGTGITVASAAQLLPVVEALVELAMTAQSVREEIDAGVKDAKEMTREQREREKEEKERWDVVRKAGHPTKEQRSEHKQILFALDQALRVVTQADAPRMAEREAAVALLLGDKKKGGKARGRAVVSDAERKALKKWSWFVAVYGRRPEPEPETKQDKGKGKQKAATEGEHEEEEDPKALRWWGFWQPEEVRKIAEWIARKNGIIDKAKHEKSKPDNGAEQRSTSLGSTKQGTISRAVSSSVANDTDVDMLDGTASSSPLTDVSDDESEEDESSELSPVSDSDEDEDGETPMYRKDAAGNIISSRTELRELVKSLREYADVLDWRISRMQVEEGQESRDTSEEKAGGRSIKSPISTGNRDG
ncbi:hypothetical protein EWM64_g7172 [Hericium alpestre]|uniref:Zinc-finger domain-containing protein n=1 Tax=Hericium alpestre TaxID=135208 RepID=A0A4Y9ZTL2_9AGAM|nr:hypothetical protein EWM64_g7172 [Hericium alpestre]